MDELERAIADRRAAAVALETAYQRVTRNQRMSAEVYLVWSHEHSAWWGPGGNGYVSQLSQAGRYSHAQALDICGHAMPGWAQRFGALPELPVRLAD